VPDWQNGCQKMCHMTDNIVRAMGSQWGNAVGMCLARNCAVPSGGLGQTSGAGVRIWGRGTQGLMGGVGMTRVVGNG
jgi:hypothetical protein